MPTKTPVHMYFIVIASFALLMTTANAIGDEENPASKDWIVGTDTHLVGEDKAVQGDLIVEPGVVLHLEGVDLAVGGTVLVHNGATMVLGPHQGTPTTLGPRPDGDGFWIHAQGNLLSHGSPPTIIQGLSGNGLDALFDFEGGIQVEGTARLQEVVVSNSSAGFVVHEGGALHLGNATVDGLNEIGIGVFGDAILENTTIRNHSLITVAGRATCDIEIRNSTLVAIRDGVVANSCRADIHHTVIRNPGVGITATGSAQLSMSNSRIEGYHVDGISSSAQPDKSPPQVYLEDVELVPGPTGKRGVELLNAGKVELQGVRITDNELVGVQSSQTNHLQIRSSTIKMNGGYGVHAVGGQLEIDLDSMDFGSVGDSTTNKEGAIEYRPLLRAMTKDDRGRIAEGFDLLVLGEGKNSVFNETGQGGTLLVTFSAYENGPDGPRFLGPFTYRVTDHNTGHVWEEPLDSLSDDLVIQVSGVEQAAPVGSMVFAFAVVSVIVGVMRWPAITGNRQHPPKR